MSVVLDVCSLPNVSHGKVGGFKQTTYKPGGAITIACDFGYEPSIVNTICQVTKEWSPQPECTKVFCNDTSDVRHAAIASFPVLAIGEKATVSYNTKMFYLYTGSVEVKCSGSKKLTWIHTPAIGKYILNKLSIHIKVYMNYIASLSKIPYIL